MKRTYQVTIKENDDDVKFMPVYAYSVVEAAYIIANTMSYERIVSITEVSSHRYHTLKMAAAIANADTWLDCEEECVELCRLAGMLTEWREAGSDTFESVLDEAAKKLCVKI